MTTAIALPGSQRLTSLDVFRGLTLAGMILVNNAGNGEHVFGPLQHASWNGWTPTDLVFPSFLFIVGTAIPFAFDRRRAQGESRGLLLLHAVRRAMVLFALGMILSGVSNNFVNNFNQAFGSSHWPMIAPYVLVVLALGLFWPAEDRIAEEGWGQCGPRMVVAGFVLLAGILLFCYYFDDFQQSAQRVPDVLQRIAVCYLLASVIVLYFGVPGRVFWTAACLVGYWAILRYVPVPADFQPSLQGPGARQHEWIDTHVLGNHLYKVRPDPEGLLSTLPAIATTLLGALAGNWLRSAHDPERKVAGLFLAGMIGLLAGLILNHWMPINKKIWTSSYVLFTGGFAAYMLAWCYLLVDLDGWRRASTPFLVLGTNCIVIYVVSRLSNFFLGYKWLTQDYGEFSAKGWLYQRILLHYLPRLGPEGASLTYAVGFVLLWMLVFAPLYRARLFIRV